MMNPKELKQTVEQICTSGKPELDTKLIKKIKKTCKCDDAVLPELHSLLMVWLKRKHSECRLSAFQVLVEIFERSHKFRTLVMADLQETLALVLETDHVRPLPPPKEAKARLKALALAKVEEWVKTFGGSYPKLHHAYNFLRQVKRVSFNALDAEQRRNQAQRQQAAEKAERMKAIWKQRTNQVRQEMQDAKILKKEDDLDLDDLESPSEFDECVLQIQNCLELLLPTPENFLHDSGGGDDEEEAQQPLDEGSMADGREHGMLDTRTTIKVGVAAVQEGGGATAAGGGLELTSENSALVENLRDQFLLLNNRLLPLAKKWIVILTKAGNDDTNDLLKKAIDIKVKLEQAESKARSLAGDEALAKAATTKAKSDDDDDDDEDDDFEEVPEKIHYEKSTEQDDVLEMVFLKSMQETSGKSKKAANVDTEEPQPGPSRPRTTTTTSVVKRSRTEEAGVPKESVPVLPFDVDLMDWGEELRPKKILVQADTHRFWGANMGEDRVVEVPGSAQRLRSIEFTGQFEPVKWACRAPLPLSGRLCPRRDRHKCPLHGPIVARDAVTGEPAAAGKETGNRPPSNGKDEVAWNDPDLLREVEQATGQDLGSSSSLKKKGRGKKSSGLTNIDLEETKTTRKRLEKKLFNRGSMRRVAASLDKADTIRTKGKFSDQFNYVHDSK